DHQGMTGPITVRERAAQYSDHIPGAEVVGLQGTGRPAGVGRLLLAGVGLAQGQAARAEDGCRLVEGGSRGASWVGAGGAAETCSPAPRPCGMMKWTGIVMPLLPVLDAAALLMEGMRDPRTDPPRVSRF